MPDTPEDPADDEARRRAFDDWWNSKPPEWNSKVSFDAGWRAAMAEVEKERAFVNRTATRDHSGEGSEVERAVGPHTHW